MGVISVYSWNPAQGRIQAQDVHPATGRLGPARMLGSMQTIGHDWVSLRRGIPELGYDQLHESFRCRQCNARAGRHYLSHRKGWRVTKNYYKPCPMANAGPLFARAEA